MSKEVRVPGIAAVFVSGAVRSEKAELWWMAPKEALKVIIKRFTKGQEKGYGVHNWKRAAHTGDLEFIRQFWNHIEEHQLKFLKQVDGWTTDDEGETPLDHLGAIGWGWVCLIWYAIHDRDSVISAFSQMPEVNK